MNVTVYPNVFSESDLEADLLSVLRAIQNGKYKEKTQACRGITDKKKRQEYKAKNLPCFTVSGIFDKKKADGLREHSGLIAIDFDDIEDLDTARAELYADKYTFAGFVSVSGNGLCLIVKIDGKKHAEAFEGLEKYYFKHYGYNIDPAGKNVNRLRYISFDPKLHLSQKSEKFAEYIPKKKGRTSKIPNYVYNQSDFEFVLQQIENNRIDLTQDYRTWIEIGFAIASEFGESGEQYYQRISQFYAGYDAEKTKKKYKSLSKKKDGKITISTFFYYAKNAGLEITTPKTKIIANVATYAKKGRRSQDQAVEQLQKIDGIPAEESKKIVEQVFKGAQVPTDDESEDLVWQVEEFLKRECKTKYNEITLKYEIDHTPLNDRDFNSLYLNCKKIVPKVSKDLFMSCIDSDRTSVYNPIENFFAKYKHREKTGLIRQLSNCISSPTGITTDYVYKFIRKWMIGAVAMWHKKHSPLMLVLAGDKQNTGKSHFFRYLLPDELQPYYAEAELTGDKDENLMMCNKILIMNDEMSNKSNRDITVMKKLCSAQWFNLRKPYGKLSEDFRRIAALCGTSNDLLLLNDPTGNRRIVPIEVIEIDHEAYNKIDKTDLWVEAYNAYKAGEKYLLANEDIRLLNDSTQKFEEVTVEAELFQKFFRKPHEMETGEYLTNAEILAACENVTKQRLSPKKMGMELKRLGFERLAKKINGTVQRVYEVIRL